jgi:hypothetical protein
MQPPKESVLNNSAQSLRGTCWRSRRCGLATATFQVSGGNLTHKPPLWTYDKFFLFCAGQIPDSIGRCTALVELDLSQNQLEGNE